MTEEGYINPQEVLGYEFEPVTFEYSNRQAILYALGIGAAQNPLDEQELAFAYEGSAQGFKVFPTFAVLFPGGIGLELLNVPGIQFNPMMLLHGEQYLEIMSPLPPSGRITSRGKISQVYDKGKGALISIDVTSRDTSGATVAFNRSTLFIRGIGGFGGDRGPSNREVSNPPDRKPDAIWQERVPENQALLYRLSGDWNPLHVDPRMAAIGGFERPILHGLCTFGYAARAVLKQFANNDPQRFKSIYARFARHFFPGETLLTEMWDAGEGEIIFRCKVIERDEFVLTKAKIQLRDQGERPE